MLCGLQLGFTVVKQRHLAKLLGNCALLTSGVIDVCVCVCVCI